MLVITVEPKIIYTRLQKRCNLKSTVFFIINNENRKSGTDYANDVIVRTLPIKPLGLTVHGLCFIGDNVFAIECVHTSFLALKIVIVKYNKVWLTANKLSLNIKKTNFVIFHPYQKRLNHEVTLKIYDNHTHKQFSLERKDYTKYLGVLIDNHLTWKYHISHVASKISRNIGIIARLRHFTPFSTLQHVYRSLIFPYLSYGLVAWGLAAQSHLEKILVLQKRAVRLMKFAQSRTHAIPYFISSNIMPISMLFFKLSSILMLDVSINSAPPSISDMFIPTGQVHKYNTRSSSAGNFYRKYSRLNHRKNSFASVEAKIWNSIPENLRKLPKHTFKIKIKNLLFFNLKKQDSYADVDTLIGEIGKVP